MTDTWTWATVTQATPLRIKVDGDTSELDATTDNLVGSLAVDDRVRVHLHSDGIIVTGLQGGNDKVYMIDHPESDQPGAYPEGITVSDTNVGVGWPSSYATAVTTAVSTSRISQVVYEKDGAERQWWRTGTGTTWTAWKEVAAYESDGRLKAADGVAADDVATVGQLPAVPYAEQAGTIDISGDGTTAADASLTFQAGLFSVAPIVICGASPDHATIAFVGSALSITATSCSIRLYRADGGVYGGSYTIPWRAVQMASGAAAGGVGG